MSVITPSVTFEQTSRYRVFAYVNGRELGAIRVDPRHKNYRVRLTGTKWDSFPTRDLAVEALIKKKGLRKP
jgi:hypothetical protein